MRFFTAIIALVIIQVPAAPAQSRDGLCAAIRDSVEAWRSRSHYPTGLALGVYWRGQVILAQATGTTRLGSGAPITARSIFHMASVTKPFVATAVMQLVDQGKVDLNAAVTRYLPYFRMNDARASALTVKQLLTHTGRPGHALAVQQHRVRSPG